jgi:hypothetical protein
MMLVMYPWRISVKQQEHTLIHLAFWVLCHRPSLQPMPQSMPQQQLHGRGVQQHILHIISKQWLQHAVRQRRLLLLPQMTPLPLLATCTPGSNVY